MKSRGQSMVEFALIAPVLCLMSFGSFDIGIAMWNKMLLNQAVYLGMRVASTQSVVNDTNVRTAVKGVAAFATDPDIVINRNYTILTSNDAIELTVTHKNTYLTQFLPGGSLLLTSRMTMLKES